MNVSALSEKQAKLLADLEKVGDEIKRISDAAETLAGEGHADSLLVLAGKYNGLSAVMLMRRSIHTTILSPPPIPES